MVQSFVLLFMAIFGSEKEGLMVCLPLFNIKIKVFLFV